MPDQCLGSTAENHPGNVFISHGTLVRIGREAVNKNVAENWQQGLA
jgi:hypothetical protein